MWQRASDKRWCERVPVKEGSKKTRLITAKSEAELKKKLKDANTYLEKGRLFSESAQAWQDAHASTIEDKTMQSYRPHVKRATAHFEGQYIKDITPDEVQAFIDSLARMRFARDTIHRALNVISMIFDFEIVQPDASIRFNTCVVVKLQKNLPKKRREPPTEEQIVKVTPDSEMGLFAYFLLFTGLRRGELLALKWEDIDFRKKVIHIRKGATYASNQKGYIFGGDQPLTATQFRKKWISWCRSAGLAEAQVTEHIGKNGHKYTHTKWLPTVTPHQFRHEYASLLEDAKISEFAAKNQLGHSSITVTKDVYTHIREKKANNGVAAKLNKYIKDKQVKKK